MIKIKEKYLRNSGKISSELIKEDFPEFYLANKSSVDSGKIIFIEEPWALEGGVLLDTETLESIFVDYRN